MNTNFKVLIFFGLCFSLGLSVFFSISEEMSIQRDPASINGKIFQLSSLSSAQIKNQLVNNIKIMPTTDGQKSLRLDGFSAALCKVYPSVELTFEANGVAVAGVFPTMTIKAPCEAGQDPAEMATIQIPVERIMAEKPRNAEFHFDGFRSKFEFANASDSWPQTWILKTVTFKSDLGQNKVVRLDRTADDSLDKKSIHDLIVLEF